MLPPCSTRPGGSIQYFQRVNISCWTQFRSFSSLLSFQLKLWAGAAAEPPANSQTSSTLVNCSNCTLKTAFCAMNTSVYYHMCTTNCSICGTVPCVVTFVCKTRDHGLFTEVHRVHMPRIGGEWVSAAENPVGNLSITAESQHTNPLSAISSLLNLSKVCPWIENLCRCL